MATRQMKVLGKGLGALLGENVDADSLRKPLGYIRTGCAPSDASMVDISLVDANPWQPRLEFDETKLSELSDSIKSLGLIQPVTLRRGENGRYQIISGERRYRACLKAGMKQIPAYVREADDRAMIEMSIVENVQRENLDPIEVALGYSCLMEECKLTQEQVSERLGKKRASVANCLRLLNLPVKIQHDLRAGLLSVGHAKVLLGVKDEKRQQDLCDAVIRESLSVSDLVKLVKQSSESDKSLGEKVRRVLGTAAKVRKSSSGKTVLSITFDTEEEVEKFLKRTRQ